MSLRERLLARFAAMVRMCEEADIEVFTEHLRKKLDPADLTPLAERIEEDILRYVDALILKQNRAAVLDRHIIGDYWPIPIGFRNMQSPYIQSSYNPSQHTEPETTTWENEGVGLSTADNCVYHSNGSTESIADYFNRTFYTKDNDGENWTEMLPDLNGTTTDWVGVALNRLWFYSLARDNTPRPNWPYWPTDVSSAELATALERSKDADAIKIAGVLREGKVPGTDAQKKAAARKHYEEGTKKLDAKDYAGAMVEFKAANEIIPSQQAEEKIALCRKNKAEDKPALAIESLVVDVGTALKTWDLSLCALVVSAEKQVEADKHVPTVRMSARSNARNAFHMLAEGPPTKGGLSHWVEGQTGLNKRTGNFELVWDGRRKPYQLNLLSDEPLSAGLVKSIQAELQDDGVRDWLTFHVMAEVQGGTGDFRWSWREHRELAGYDRKAKNSRTTDADLAAMCVSRITKLTRAEARIESTRGGRIAWVRIGDHGLLDVPAGIDEITEAGRLTTVAAIRLNKAILAGARARESKPYYALIHQGIIVLPRIERTLGTILAFDWRVARDRGGTVVRTARKLWDYARIQGGHWNDRKRWPQTRQSLNHALDVLGVKIGLNWHAEPDGAHGLDGPDARYIIEPPAWWRDRVLHGVSPVLRTNTAGIPRTGIELAEWRSEHGVSLRQAGAILNVSYEAVRKAEAKAETTLPAEWLPLMAKARKG